MIDKICVCDENIWVMFVVSGPTNEVFCPLLTSYDCSAQKSEFWGLKPVTCMTRACVTVVFLLYRGNVEALCVSNR